MAAISGDRSVAQAMVAASTEIVHVVGIGDSNQVHNSNGWDNGWQYAFLNANTTARMFATGWTSPNNNGQSGFNIGYLSAESFIDIGDTSTDYSEFDSFVGPSGTFDSCNVASGSTSPASSGVAGVYLDSTHPQLTEAAQWQGHYGTFDNTPSGAATFAPRARTSPSNSGIPGYTHPGTVSCKTGTFGLAVATVQWPADAGRNEQIQAGYKRPGFSNIVGPFFAPFNRIVFTEQNSGFAYTTLLFQGGQSCRVAANSILGMESDFFSTMFGKMRQDSIDASQTPKVVIKINHGLNDRNDTNASVGPATESDSSTAAGFVDNVTAIVNEFETRWTAEGWDTSELHFAIMPAHRIATTEDTDLAAYRSAIETYAASRSRILSINPTDLNDYSEYTANSNAWLSGGSDAIHLSKTGHEQVALTALNAIQDYAQASSKKKKIMNKLLGA